MTSGRAWRRSGGARRGSPILAAALALVFSARALAGADCPSGGPDTPRTLILALDGVPYRVVERARQNGAFQGWPEARPLVSTFPSMTNVGFAAILEPLGADAVPGYEVRHYDPDANRISGGGLASKKKSFAWKELFQRISRGNVAKARIYMTPRRKSLDEFRDVERLVETSPAEVMLAHVAATDSLSHFQGDEVVERVLVELSQRLEVLRREHLETRSRPLRVLLLSDHGNTDGKVRIVKGVRKALRRAGLRPAERLKRAGDVVPVTYGVVGYAALFTTPPDTVDAARAVVALEGVALAVYRSARREITVVSNDGTARILWEGSSRRRFAYVADAGDPLALSATVDRMARRGRVDARGFASGDDWLQATVGDAYPDAPRRLVDSLTGTFVSNAASVLLSMDPGWAWGLRSTRAGAWLRGGKLEGTHGGLDRESSLGFLMSSEGGGWPEVVRADRALTPLAELRACLGVGPESGMAVSRPAAAE